jgi:hypothetical protein
MTNSLAKNIPEVAEAVVEMIRLLDDTPLEIEAALTLTVKMPNGSYRKKAVNHENCLFLKSAYVGARSATILCFASESTSEEYSSVEIPMNNVDKTIPLFAATLREAMGITTEQTNTLKWSLKRTLVAVEGVLAVKRDEEESKKMALIGESYSANSDFGMF